MNLAVALQATENRSVEASRQRGLIQPSLRDAIRAAWPWPEGHG